MAEITNKSAVTNAIPNDGSKTIKPGLRADVMRKLMETKNTLTKKGSIYVGTGNKETVTIGGDTCNIYETTALGPDDFKCSNSEGCQFLGGDTTNGVFIIDKDVLCLKIEGNKNFLVASNGVIAETVQATAELLVGTNSTSASGATVKIYGKTDSPTITLTGEDGTISMNGACTANQFNANSDRRRKENISDYECGKSILDLPVKRFDFIDGPKNQIGCIAQDLREICPEIVQEDEKGYLSIQESKIVYLLLQEVKRLRGEVDALKGGE